jgi:CRISPR-associated protein Csx10
MKVINYRVTLLEPTLVTSLQGDPNSAVAFDYLPGSVLRGVLIGKYLEYPGSKSVDTSDSTLRRLFFNGTSRYLNGYPLDIYDHPSVPVPLSWQREKDNEDEIFDFAVEVQDDKKQWQPVTVPFYTQSGEDVRLIRPTRNIAVHTQRTARFGRAMPQYLPADRGQVSRGTTTLLEADEIAGAVYRDGALAAGQIFQAAIICENDDDEPVLRTLIDGYVTLGGSRSGGYGRAKINLVADHDSDGDAAEDAEDVPEGKLIVTLQSNVLLRDTRGQFAVDPELLRRVLSRHLRVDLEPEDAFLSAEAVGGFNRKWGLPLPQALAVRMGSVLIFKDPGCDPTLLDDLEARGIGERRAEGFGRIAFNQQRMTKMNVTENMGKSRGPDNFTISQTEARNLAKLMVKRILRQRLDEGLLHAANGVKIANPPSNAQISCLRGIVLEELRKATPDIGKIHGFIESIEGRGSARRQFERSTANEEPLLRWLKRLLRYGSEGAWTMADNEWKGLLRLSGNEVDTRIGDVKAEIDDGLRLEYVLRLIDLVLAHAAKQRGKEN